MTIQTLITACRGFKLDEIKELVEAQNIGVNQKDEQGYTPLLAVLEAAAEGPGEEKGWVESIVIYLLSKGADVKASTSKETGEKTALHFAATKRWFGITEALLRQGADIHALDRQLNAPLATAIEHREHVSLDRFREKVRESRAGNENSSAEIKTWKDNHAQFLAYLNLLLAHFGTEHDPKLTMHNDYHYYVLSLSRVFNTVGNDAFDQDLIKFLTTTGFAFRHGHITTIFCNYQSANPNAKVLIDAYVRHCEKTLGHRKFFPLKTSESPEAFFIYCQKMKKNERYQHEAGTLAALTAPLLLNYICIKSNFSRVSLRDILQAGGSLTQRDILQGSTPLHYTLTFHNIEASTAILDEIRTLPPKERDKVLLAKNNENETPETVIRVLCEEALDLVTCFSDVSTHSSGSDIKSALEAALASAKRPNLEASSIENTETPPSVPSETATESNEDEEDSDEDSDDSSDEESDDPFMFFIDLCNDEYIPEKIIIKLPPLLVSHPGILERLDNDGNTGLQKACIKNNIEAISVIMAHLATMEPAEKNRILNNQNSKGETAVGIFEKRSKSFAVLLLMLTRFMSDSEIKVADEVRNSPPQITPATLALSGATPTPPPLVAPGFETYTRKRKHSDAEDTEKVTAAQSSSSSKPQGRI